MLVNQVALVIDDEIGSGLQLTERLLLEDSIVILCTENVTEPLQSWQEDIIKGRLIVVDLTGIKTIDDLEELFQKTVRTLKRIDCFIQCNYLKSQSGSEWKDVMVRSHDIVNTATDFLGKSKGTSLLLIRTEEDSDLKLNDQYSIDEVSRTVTCEADHLIRNGIRHNLIIHESASVHGHQSGFTNAAIFLSSDWGNHVYGQVMLIRESELIYN